MVDQMSFLSGGQDGILNLWSKNKKRPVHQVRDAHGAGAWISSVSGGRFSDVVASGSNRGSIKLWKLGGGGGSSSKERSSANKLISLGDVAVEGYINAMSFGRSHSSLLFAGVGRDHRFGRWETVQQAKNSVQIIRLK
eukprot:TRINITY_DN937_c0_g1_i1.p1 TRINITY_DN937_c0_g1~~TRINITY_DN937_c0_g1_i1.p1  ORF type:complete len:138 (-),score=37.45 TRINITY_DN937_c0_g1_i1:34-447(-)